MISEAPGQGRQLKHRRDTKRRKEFLANSQTSLPFDGVVSIRSVF